MKKEIFILSSETPEQLGGLEACVREQVRGFQKLGYGVRVFHRKNSGPDVFRRNDHRITHHLSDTLAEFFIGRTVRKAMHPGVAAVFSHATVNCFHGLRFWRLRWWGLRYSGIMTARPQSIYGRYA